MGEQARTDGGLLVRVEHHGGVATLTLDSPHNRNALSARLMAQLLDALQRAVDDDAVRVVLLTHTGRVFCSGVDLKETSGGSASGGLPVSAMPAVLQALWECPKPVVARVAGPARAGGLGLIGACDLVVAAADATFAFTEVRLGVVPAVISATVLPRLAPRAAQELLLTGAAFDGARAAAIGLVTVATAAEDLDAEVDRQVGMLLRGGPAALAATKRLLRERAGPPIGEELERLSVLSVGHFTSEEGREGVAAAREKRDAAWVPRR